METKLQKLKKTKENNNGMARMEIKRTNYKTTSCQKRKDNFIYQHWLYKVIKKNPASLENYKKK